MLRRWWRAYLDALSNETNVVLTASSGVLWVISPAVGAALFSPARGTDTRLAFYEVSATIIPVLLLAYFVEHAAMTASIARSGTAASDPQRKQDGEHLLATGRALAALIAASSATGEILALYAVGRGASSAFLCTGTIIALGIVGGAILLFAIARIGRPPMG
jgi:hypothetical protein